MNNEENILKGIVNLFSYDNKKIYLTSTFTKITTLHQFINFHIVFSPCTWFTFNKYLFKQNLLCYLI